MHKLAILAAAALAAAAPAGTLAAQTHRQTIVRQLGAVTARQVGEGYAVDRRAIGGESLIGLLPANGSVLLEVNLRAGHEYFIAAGCDTDCEDLDLRVLAQDRETVLAEDTAADDVPILTFTARETGPHLLAVMMPTCNTEMCYFGFTVLAR